MSWIERNKAKLADLGRRTKPAVEQMREDATPKLEAARQSAEKAGAKAGASLRSRMDEITKAFNDGAHGDESSDKAPPPSA